jgi:hypothetical protein
MAYHPGRSAGICPIEGVYVYTEPLTRTNQDATVELIPCESSGGCSTANCSTALIGTVVDTFTEEEFFLRNGLVVGAVCAEGTTGFLCAECADDYVKVDSQCVPCTGFSWPVFLSSITMSFGAALFLLHISTKSQSCTDGDLRNIWHKFDTEKRGYLEPIAVLNAMRMTGKHYTDEVFAKFLKKQFGLVDQDRGTVSIEDFMQVVTAMRPSGNVGTLIFFLQTLGLIVKNAAEVFRPPTGALDLNAEEATQSCM